MRCLLLTVALIATTAQAQESGRDSMEFQAYQARLRYRYYNALNIRREMNAGKVHQYWTAVRVNFNPSLPFGNFIERNMVRQPPIPRRYAPNEVRSEMCGKLYGWGMSGVPKL